MRYSLLFVALTGIVLTGLSGCGSNPGSLGLTGAPLATPPEAQDDSVINDPGVPQGDSAFNPSVQQTTGGGRFYGY